MYLNFNSIYLLSDLRWLDRKIFPLQFVKTFSRGSKERFPMTITSTCVGRTVGSTIYTPSTLIDLRTSRTSMRDSTDIFLMRTEDSYITVCESEIK